MVLTYPAVRVFTPVPAGHDLALLVIAKHVLGHTTANAATLLPTAFAAFTIFTAFDSGFACSRVVAVLLQHLSHTPWYKPEVRPLEGSS